DTEKRGRRAEELPSRFIARIGPVFMHQKVMTLRPTLTGRSPAAKVVGWVPWRPALRNRFDGVGSPACLLKVDMARSAASRAWSPVELSTVAAEACCRKTCGGFCFLSLSIYGSSFSFDAWC
ncbi:unnamed protein product, partial [Ectocarpus sp. 13 AM-2016]